MGNFTRTHPDGVWITGYQPPPSDFEDLMRKAFQGVNGVVGGTYAPSSTITVGGAGLRVTGPTKILGSGKLVMTTGSVITLADGDYQDLLEGHPGRTRTIWQPMAPVRPVGVDLFAFMNVLPAGAVQAIASTFRRATGDTVPEFVKGLRVHDGSKLTKVELRFRVPTPHAAVPQEMPKVRLFRLRLSDGVAENLCSTALGDGLVPIPTPSSGVKWYSNGDVQSFVITPDQNNLIDTSQYVYMVHIVEERAGVQEFPFTVKIYESAVIGVASNAPNPLSGDLDSYGAPWPAGTVGLFKDETQKQYNGLWVAPGGAGSWTRHASLNSEAQFTNGMLFLVSPAVGGYGKANPGTVWQLSLPQPFVLNTTPVNIAKPVPQGTIFLGMMTTFSNITSTRYQ